MSVLIAIIIVQSVVIAFLALRCLQWHALARKVLRINCEIIEGWRTAQDGWRDSVELAKEANDARRSRDRESVN